MREIKLRIFDKDKNKYISAKNEIDFNDDGLLVRHNYSVIEEFTGAKDCFEKEIYEGDIMFLDSRMITGKITMEFCAWKIRYGNDIEWLCDYCDGELHVIGNVNEHPDLLL